MSLATSCLVLAAVVTSWNAPAAACPNCRVAAAGLADGESAGWDWKLTGGVDHANANFHRGYVQQQGGLLIQPFATLACEYARSERVHVTPYLQAWASLDPNGSNATSAAAHHGGNNTSAPAEFMAATLLSAGDLWVDVKYAVHSHPTAANTNVQEIGAKISYDLALRPATAPDASCAPDNALGVKPHVAVFREIGDPSGPDHSYLEAGMEPYLRLAKGGRTVGLSLPFRVGLGSAGYYRDRAGLPTPLGYWSLGGRTSVPLGDGTWGRVYLSASADVLHLVAASAARANGNRPNAIVARLGLGFSY